MAGRLSRRAERGRRARGSGGLSGLPPAPRGRVPGEPAGSSALRRRPDPGAHAPAQGEPPPGPARAAHPGPGERGRGKRLDRERRPGRHWRPRGPPHRGIPALRLRRRRRGDQDAAGHMLEVRQVAHESLREMRAVVSGYRTADLGTELAGAQEVLRSAGVSCRVIGDAAGLPPDVQAALGGVIREGTTNIIRHSDATACTIELHILDSPGAPRAVTLSMDNDRVHTPAAGSGGNGLAGLGERLAGLGGSITTGHPRNGHFRLEASLPAGGAAAVPPGPGKRVTGVTPETPAP